MRFNGFLSDFDGFAPVSLLERRIRAKGGWGIGLWKSDRSNQLSPPVELQKLQIPRSTRDDKYDEERRTATADRRFTLDDKLFFLGLTEMVVSAQR